MRGKLRAVVVGRVVGEVRQACRQDSVVHSRVKIAVYRPWSVMVSLLTEDDPEFSTLFRQILVDHRAKLVNVIDACHVGRSCSGPRSSSRPHRPRSRPRPVLL
jgi:hypothetical protein